MNRDYGSHISVLKLISKTISTPIESIIEFGCGKFSTLTFLNKNIFPDLKSLWSLESNLDWTIKFLSQIEDERLQFVYNTEENLLKIPELDIIYDLAFIDGATAEYRVPSFNAVKAKIIVIHDADKDYWQPINKSDLGFKILLFNEFFPPTAIYIPNWNIQAIADFQKIWNSPL